MSAVTPGTRHILYYTAATSILPAKYQLHWLFNGDKDKAPPRVFFPLFLQPQRNLFGGSSTGYFILMTHSIRNHAGFSSTVQWIRTNVNAKNPLKGVLFVYLRFSIFSANQIAFPESGVILDISSHFGTQRLPF